MQTPRPSVFAALAGVAVGLVAAGVLVVAGVLDDRVAAPPPADASEAFIAAFQRSLEGTYVVHAEYTRELTSGRTLRSNVLVAQRPPDSIRRQFGGISGTLNGKQVACSSESDGTFHCGPSADAPDRAGVIAGDLENLRSYFAAPALYQAVRSGADCFELTQLRPSGVVPYGSRARFCFDPATGAISELVQELEGATDTFKASDIRAQVTVQDFALNDDRLYDADTGAPADDGGTSPEGSDPGAGTTPTTTG